jgi:poly-gamma-glutamate synthesis protein (capsule biosynthesis protein)
VRSAAAGVDLLIVAIHKGLVHTPVTLADYEQPIAHAAIDAGADAVIGHHAHIMRGVEMYRGRAIFHGLGNFVTVTRALGGAPGDAPERARWARERRRLFGFEPDPEMPLYPFHPESRNTAIAVIEVGDDGALRFGAIPCWIESDGQPVPLGRTARGEAVADYLRAITVEAGLRTDVVWDDSQLAIREIEDGTA